jgi:hypothetical protein
MEIAGMIKVLMLVGIILSRALVSAGQMIQEPRTFFRDQIGLSDGQIATIDGGGAVVKMLPSKTPAEVFIFEPCMSTLRRRITSSSLSI